MKYSSIIAIIALCAATAASATRFTVFKADSKRYGMMRNDSIIVDAVFDRIGFTDKKGNFITDSVSPDGYASVYFGKTKSWNAIDTCGNLIFAYEGIAAPVASDRGLAMQINDNESINAAFYGKPVTIDKVDCVYRFMLDGHPVPYNNNTYTELQQLGGRNLLLAYDGKNYYVTDRLGHVLTPGYESLIQQPLKIRKYPLMLGSKPGGKEILTSLGKGVSWLYDDIIPVYHENRIKGYLYLKNEKWAYVTTRQIADDGLFYDYIDDFDRAGRANIFYKGYRGTIDINGNKIEDICGRLFRSGLSDDYTPAQKMAIYKEVVALAKDVNEDRYLGGSYMNIARLYEDAGDMGRAIEYYELAEGVNARDAGENAGRLRSKRNLERISMIVGAIDNFVSALAGGTSDYMSGEFGAPASTYGYSTAVGSSLEGQYRNWERRAKSIYESLTNTGYKTTENNKAKGGSTGKGMSGGNFIAQKRLLRDAQSQMKDIRRKAAKQNINITQSQYETVNVNY